MDTVSTARGRTSSKARLAILASTLVLVLAQALPALDVRKGAADAALEKASPGQLGILFSLDSAEPTPRWQVTDAPRGLPAYEAGIRQGDHLLALTHRGREVALPPTPREMAALFGQVRAGEKVALLIERDGQRSSIVVVAQEMPDENVSRQKRQLREAEGREALNWLLDLPVGETVVMTLRRVEGAPGLKISSGELSEERLRGLEWVLTETEFRRSIEELPGSGPWRLVLGQNEDGIVIEPLGETPQ